jgi:transcriptional regulator with XRE-family HTH domain
MRWLNTVPIALLEGEMAGNREAALWMKSRRKRLNMTQEGLAEKVHCDVETIRKYEAAKRTPQYDIAERLMIAFEIPPEHRDSMVAWFRNNQSPDWQPSITFDEPANSPSSLGMIGRGGDNQEQADIDKENGMIIHFFAHRLRRSAKLITTSSGVLSLLVVNFRNSWHDLSGLCVTLDAKAPDCLRGFGSG